MLKLTYSNLEFQNFLGEDPPDPSSRGGEGRGGRRGQGKGKGRREGKDREGRGGTGTDRGGKEGRNGGGEVRGARHWLRPLETSSGSPCGVRINRRESQKIGSAGTPLLWGRDLADRLNVSPLPIRVIT